MTDHPDRINRFVRLAAVIGHELERVESTVLEAGTAIERFQRVPPSMLELRGLGGVVHDYYTGVEKVLERIASEFDGGVPAGRAWHRELLEAMALSLPALRPAVLSDNSFRMLEEFLRFRHLFRHVYGFELEWSRLQPLLAKMPRAWSAVQSDFRNFLVFLEDTTRADQPG